MKAQEIRDQVKALVAREAIREKLACYCRSVDRLDHELGYSVFTDDSVLDYGENFKGSGKEFIDWCCNAHLTYFSATSHHISNFIIVIKGKQAFSETYIHGVMRGIPDDEGEAVQTIVFGRYLDEWSCLDNGDWRIARRRFVQDFSELCTVETDMGAFAASRDHHDPSYEFLK